MISRRRWRIWSAVLISWLLPLAGCTSSVVLTPDVEAIKPKLSLKEGEFRVVRTVSGRASCPFLLHTVSVDVIVFEDIEQRGMSDGVGERISNPRLSRP
jgi:hypothetical protein